MIAEKRRTNLDMDDDSKVYESSLPIGEIQRSFIVNANETKDLIDNEIYKTHRLEIKSGGVLNMNNGVLII